jgi:hypothetical protein
LFINDPNWPGLELLKWPEGFAASEEGIPQFSFGQWIYVLMYKRLITLIKAGEDFVDIPRLAEVFEDYIINRTCGDCVLRDLNYVTFPYAWNECDSFSFLNSGVTSLKGVRMDCGVSCVPNQCCIAQLGSRMGVRFFGDHSILCSGFVGNPAVVPSGHFEDSDQ